MTGWWGGSGDDPVTRQALAYGASQHPEELAAVVELARSARPLIIVEIGCDRGGTLYAWRQICREVYGITLADNGQDAGGSGLPLERHGAQVHVGDSHSPAARAWLCNHLYATNLDRWCPLVDVLAIDGDHTYEGVWADLEMYGPLVKPGGLILLHDIHSVPPHPEFRLDVPRVWAECVAAAYDTSEIHAGGPGWGVIRRQVSDSFRRTGDVRAPSVHPA